MRPFDLNNTIDERLIDPLKVDDRFSEDASAEIIQ